MATIARNYQIAAGHNNAAGLTLLNEISDADGVRFVQPRGLPYRIRGQLRYRTDGSVARVGFNQIQWQFGVMTLGQYKLMLDTYEGLVTIHTALTNTTFANYNATLVMPDERDMEYGWLTGSVYDTGYTGPGYRNVIATFNYLEAI